MSASLSPSQTSAILHKSSAMLKNDEKPAGMKLVRSSSIERILLICSPPYYTLPAILTWLKSSKNSLNASAENTIFLFRALIFSSIFYKYFAKPAQVKLVIVKNNFEKDLKNVVLNVFEKSSEPAFLIKFAFYMVAVVLSVQLACCLLFLSKTTFPVGLGFLIVCLVVILRLGHCLNKFCYGKKDVKRKTL